MFDNIAPRYDLLNRLLSLNIDRSWRKKLVRQLLIQSPSSVLDIACGTGDLTIAISKSLTKNPSTVHSQIVGADLSPQMIKVAQGKFRKLSLDIPLHVADAEKLPFDDESFDAVTCAFGVRNFEDLDKGLSQARRVIKQGGRIYVLEFSTPKASIFARLFKFYFHRILPPIAGFISKDRKAYTYLPQSVDEFPSTEAFCEILKQLGFENCTARPLTFGVATLYIGEKR